MEALDEPQGRPPLLNVDLEANPLEPLIGSTKFAKKRRAAAARRALAIPHGGVNEVPLESPLFVDNHPGFPLVSWISLVFIHYHWLFPESLPTMCDTCPERPLGRPPTVDPIRGPCRPPP